MPYINFINMSSVELAVVLDTVFDCIKTASRHNGKVYGGFVRDVVVPRLSDPSCFVEFKDVDLWFTNQADADAFICYMCNLFVKFKGVDVTPYSYPGAFSRTQYHLTKFDTCLAWIDVIVSPTLPVNDFDVNEVTYSLLQNGIWITTAPPRLIDQIKDKHAVMLLPYQKLIDGARDCKISSSFKFNPNYKIYYMERIKRIFTNQGWKVSFPTAREI